MSGSQVDAEPGVGPLPHPVVVDALHRGPLLNHAEFPVAHQTGRMASNGSDGEGCPQRAIANH